MTDRINMKPTPGPWTVGKWDDRTSGWHIDAATCPHIASALYIGGTALARANATLMAAAPDLLAAAEEALERLEKGAPGWGVAKDVLRAAIHKAKGNAQS